MDGKPFAATARFAGGYLLAWTAFSLAVFLAHGLERATYLRRRRRCGATAWRRGVNRRRPLSAGRCSRRRACPIAKRRSHLSCATAASAVIPPVLCLGLRHGLYCIGCCWALMALLLLWGHEFSDRRARNPCVTGESHTVRADHRATCGPRLHGGGRRDVVSTRLKSRRPHQTRRSHRPRGSSNGRGRCRVLCRCYGAGGEGKAPLAL